MGQVNERPSAIGGIVLPRTYIETFDSGPGGWLAWDSNTKGAKPIQIVDGVAVTRGPWWIDYNHAPPGGGYLQLPFALHTRHGPGFPQQYLDLGGVNHFVDGGFPTDLTDARVTIRARGEMQWRGARVMLLVQGKLGDKFVNHVLTGEAFQIASEWSESSVTLAPDPAQWKCMGSRHDRMDFYGWGEIGDLLRDVNADIILVHHRIDITPAEPLNDDMHRLRAGEDYTVDPSRLPEGYWELDEVRIEFPNA